MEDFFVAVVSKIFSMKENVRRISESISRYHFLGEESKCIEYTLLQPF